MTWHTQAQQLVEHLRADGITDERVLQRFLEVPRQKFVPPELAREAWEDCALAIGEGQTISQPYIVALMTQAADLSPDSRVLEIGTGSGYQAAILAGLCRELITLERIPVLAQRAAGVWCELGYANIECRIIDGSGGWPAGAPYDAILVTAGAPGLPPDLLNQLTDEGRLVIPEGPSDRQLLKVYCRHGHEATSHKLCDCRFVKLIGRGGWPAEVPAGEHDPVR